MDKLVKIMERDDKLNHRAYLRNKREANKAFVALNATHIDRNTGEKIAVINGPDGQKIITARGNEYRWFSILQPVETYYKPILDQEI